ncbi:MAG: PepSY domain-containing protein [Burkholderiales bacterium]|nr:PepSY domain-containing protein [Burkholderiales bacterium]
MKEKLLIAAVGLAVLAPGIAFADDDCQVPMAQWQSRRAVEEMASARGWTVRRIKVDDGCYEIKGQDETGRDIEVKIDPASLAIVKLKHKDRRAERDHERTGTRGAGAAPTGADGTAPPPGRGVVNKGTPPRVDVQ